MIRRPPRGGRGPSLLGILGLGFLGFIGLSALLSELLPIIIVGAIGYCIYYFATKKSKLEKINTAQCLQDLKDKVQQADRQVKLLDNYLDEKDYTQYIVVARQLLPKLRDIKSEAGSLKDKMDFNIYKRIVKKAIEVEDDVSLQLDRLDVAPDTDPVSHQDNDILQRAPELRTVYQNIQRDHATILEKIEHADNKSELMALHEADMMRFKDILSGYLKIKESPKDYYNAEERLAQAKEALDKFDLALDETLKRLNESDLKDFDISLRMMKDEKTNL